MRPSSIKRQPPEIRELIGQLRQDGRTIDEIMAKLQELGADVSRSAMGRHVKQLDDVLKQVRESRAIAEAIVKSSQNEPQDKTAQANIQMMHGIVIKFMANLASAENEGLDAKDVMFMARAIEGLTKASKDDAERELKIREQAKKEAAKAMETVARKNGLSAEMIEKLKAEALGIAK